MQKSNNFAIIFCCFAAIILYTDAASVKDNSNSNNNNNDLQQLQPEQDQRYDDVEEQIRNYVKQVRAKEQLEMLRAMRQRQILAAIDPREYYEQPAQNQNNNAQNVLSSSDSESSPTADKRAQSFVRFGKRAQTFVRFGKRAQTFVRFGRDPARSSGPIGVNQIKFGDDAYFFLFYLITALFTLSLSLFKKTVIKYIILVPGDDFALLSTFNYILTIIFFVLIFEKWRHKKN
uniref:Uncharacterized protein n=1 Tax=Panagrolaimus sp. ES5 TaxID=591445 RepID=A0AC34FJG7_9BILA